MISLSRRLLPFSVLASFVAANLSAADAAKPEPAIIAKARAFVGPEVALNAVKSVHFVGMLTTADSADPAKAARAVVEIFFQAPDQQRMQAVSDKVIDVTALDGYEAWHRVQDPVNSANQRISYLGTDETRRLRINTWESLSFYRGIEAHGGHIEEQGTVPIDGVTCAKVAFIYDHGIVFYRYIDVATGHLVMTENEAGNLLREEGAMMSSGVRFPRSIITINKKPNGQTQTSTLTFDKITVNETMPASLFAVPSPGAK